MPVINLELNESILVNYWCGRKNPMDARRVAERAVAGKFKGVKIKGHPGDPVVQVVEAIASVSPALQVTVDFNDQIANAKEFCLSVKRWTQCGEHAGSRGPDPERGSRGLPGASTPVEDSSRASPERSAKDDGGYTG